jgi:hypothetical protein
MPRIGTVYQIRTPHLSAGVIVDDGVAVLVSPIIAHLRGKKLTEVAEWVCKRRGTIEMVINDLGGGLK